jgi:DNA-binding transcriptional LysR family regulator
MRLSASPFCIMLEQLRLLMAVIEEGSLRRAAERAHISQSAVTRQMQLLEHDLGGRILERTSTGVRPTTAGYALVQKAKLLLADYDSTMSDVRRLVRGEGEQLRIGYLASAGQQYLDEPIRVLRRLHPKVKVKMLDLTPGEAISALRRGEIDLALSHVGMDLLSRDFYTRKIDNVPGVAVLPIHHRLASQKTDSDFATKARTLSPSGGDVLSRLQTESYSIVPSLRQVSSPIHSSQSCRKRRRKFRHLWQRRRHLVESNVR